MPIENLTADELATLLSQHGELPVVLKMQGASLSLNSDDITVERETGRNCVVIDTGF
jgi:type IV secretory pathway VirB4 component